MARRFIGFHLLLRVVIAALLSLRVGVSGASAATITWTGKSDGKTWIQAANWDANRLPNGTDDVVIPADFTGVEHPTATTRIRSLVADGGLRITGGSLTITNGESRAGGAFVVAAGASFAAIGPKVRFTMTGTPVAWEGSLDAAGGAVLQLSSLVRITGRTPDWSATGAGTLVDARNVTNINLTTTGFFPLTATAGAVIQLPGLPSLRGAIRPTATLGGTLDFSGVTGRWSSDGFSYRGMITATGGGQIIGRGLSELDLIDVELDGKGVLTTATWTAFTGGELTLRGASPNLDQVTNLDEAHLVLSEGGTARLPSLRIVRGRNPSWDARDDGTLIEARGITSLAVARDGWFPVTAANLARVDLGGLGTLRGSLRPTATTGGTIDLSSLKGLWSCQGYSYVGILSVTRQGSILCPGLTDLDTVNVELDSAEGIATGQWKSLVRGTLKLSDATPDFSHLTNLEDTDLQLVDGAVARLPALQEIRGRNSSWQARGFGTRIEARQVTSMALSTDGWFPAVAENDGVIDLGGLTTVRGSFRPTATSGGIVDLSALRGTWTSDGFSYIAIMTAHAGGEIICPGLVGLDKVNVDLDDTGRLATAHWTSFTRGALTLAGARPEFPVLANLDETDLALSQGAVARFPALSILRAHNPSWSAKDAGTVIDARTITTIQLSSDSWFPLLAENQAIINLSGLTSIAGAFRPEARSGGVIDLSGVRGGWSSVGYAYEQIVTASSGGRVAMDGVTSFARGEIRLGQGGLLPTDQFVEILDSRVTVDGLQTIASFASLKDSDGTTFEAKNGARIVFSGLPRIVEAPVGGRPAPGAAFQFTVSAEGDEPLRYQWLRNGQPLRGENAATLHLAGVSAEDAGAYSVVVFNALGSVRSEPAVLGIALPSLPLADLLAQRGLVTATAGAGIGDNLKATREAGEPRHAGKTGGHSVWIAWKAPNSGSAAFRTLGSSFDTLLAVYTRNRAGDLVEVASDDDSGRFLTSEVRFPATQGVEYLVAIDGHAGATGTIVLSWDLDLRLAAFPTITLQPTNTLAFVGQPTQLTVAAEPEGVTFQWFFQGRALAGQDRSTLAFPSVTAAIAGAYHVGVGIPGGTSVVSRTAILDVTDRPQAAVAPSADKLADLFPETEAGAEAGSPATPFARLLSLAPAAAPPPAVGLPGSQWTDNSDSTSSPDEPEVCEAVTSATRWFRLRFNLPAGIEQQVQLTTVGSEIATLLAVFTNNAAPRMIACDVARPPQTTSSAVQIGARRNVDYLVLVDGVAGATGQIQLNWAAEQLAPPTIELREGRFHFQTRVTPGQYDWQQGSAIDAWQTLFRTNAASGVFDFLDSGPASGKARFFRLVPVP